jgi:hypothetical protein
MQSQHLDYTIERVARQMRDYEDHRRDMISGYISGDVAIEKSVTMAAMIFLGLDDIGFYIRGGYAPTEPIPDEIAYELAERGLML